MCQYCKAHIYIKEIQYMKPVLAPLTEVDELRQRLLDLTGEVYVELPKRFCPMCGAEVEE